MKLIELRVSLDTSNYAWLCFTKRTVKQRCGESHRMSSWESKRDERCAALIEIVSKEVNKICCETWGNNSHKKINGKTTIINLVLLLKQADDIFKLLIKFTILRAHYGVFGKLQIGWKCYARASWYADEPTRPRRRKRLSDEKQN